MIKTESLSDAGQAGPEGTDDVSAALAPLDRPASQRNWPRAPAAAEWAALSEAERAGVVAGLEAWLSSGALDFMAEGPTHLDKKYKSMDRLRRYFSGRGRRIYVAAEMGVFYPGETAIVPDVMAVLDADPPKGESWMVAIEGKGPDWALEIHVAGDLHKDIEENVEKYARLGISEYFVFDFNRKLLFSHRLPRAGTRRYQKVRPRLGRYHSEVLDLDLAVVEGELCFFQDTAQLLGADELIAQLQGMVDELSDKAQEEREVLRQQVLREREARLREQEEHMREREARMRELTQALFAILAARGLVVPDEVRARILACTEPALLAQWLPRAAICATAEEIFAGQ